MFALSSYKPKFRQILYVVVLTGLIVRVLYLLNLPNELIFGDAEDYWVCSENIIHGNGFSLQPTNDRLAHVPPGYPLFLAFLKILGVSSLFYIRLVQVLLSVLLIPIIYYIGAKIFSKKVMTITILLYAISPHLIYWSTQIATENLAIVLFTLSFFVYVRGLTEDNIRLQIFSVFLLGLAALTRSVFLFAIPIFLLGGIIQKKEWLRRTLMSLSVFIIVLLPWTIRNYLLFNHFVPVTLGTGYARVGKLVSYSNDYSDVFNQNNSFYSHHYYLYHHPQTPMDEYISDKALESLATQMMKAHPMTTIRFFMWNFLRFWTPGVTFYAEDIQYKQFIPSFVFGGMLFPFAILGLKKIYSLNRTIFIVIFLILLYFSLVHSYFIGMLRYRMPLEVILYLSASSGIVCLYEKLKSSRKTIKRPN